MKQLITLQNPLITTKITLLNLLISPTHQLYPQTHLKKSLISAKWGKKRSKSRNNKLIFNAITTVVSNLKILPEPFDSLVKQFLVVSGGGNGGNFRFKNGFGGNGDGGNGGRSNKAKKLGFWVVLVISISLGIWGVLKREKLSDFGCLCLLCGNAFVFGYCLWRKDVRNWVFGFFCGVALIMGLGFKDNDNLIKFVHGFKANFRNFGVVFKKRRYKRWI